MDFDKQSRQVLEEKEPPYDLDLYELLKNADNKKLALDQWWREHPNDVPNLRGAPLHGWDLREADLRDARLENAILAGATLNGADLENANLEDARLEEDDYIIGVDIPGFGFNPTLIRLTDAYKAANITISEISRAPYRSLGLAYIEVLRTLGFKVENLQSEATIENFQPGAAIRIEKLPAASLQGANLRLSNLAGASLAGVNLAGANLDVAILEGAGLAGVNLSGTSLDSANLKNANLRRASLQGANLRIASLEGAELVSSDLRGVYARYALVDGSTWLDEDCTIDGETDFAGVGLDNARIEEQLRAKLKHNIRKHHWEGRTYHLKMWSWDQHQVVNNSQVDPIVHKGQPWSNPMWLVMLASNYGSSTTRLVLSFIFVSVLFSILYLLPTPASQWAFWPTFKPDHWLVERPFLKGLDESEYKTDEKGNLFGLRFLRAFYFSVVTMTTLGFGDITAHPLSIIGHLLVIIQVVIGYILLGGLITRLAVLFQNVE